MIFIISLNNLFWDQLIVNAHNKIILTGDSSNVYPSKTIMVPMRNGEPSRNIINTEGALLLVLFFAYNLPVAPIT